MRTKIIYNSLLSGDACTEAALSRKINAKMNTKNVLNKSIHSLTKLKLLPQPTLNWTTVGGGGGEADK